LRGAVGALRASAACFFSAWSVATLAAGLSGGDVAGRNAKTAMTAIAATATPVPIATSGTRRNHGASVSGALSPSSRGQKPVAAT
jgi:hypothetical protein